MSLSRGFDRADNLPVTLQRSGMGGALVSFIHDTPAEIDYFGPHSAIADAIVRAFSEDEKIRVIGLLGSWGSGKSTVVRQIAKRLRKDGQSNSCTLFEYDTWLSQNDPPRRAFMEALIGTLTRGENAALKASEWEGKLKELKGEVQETITTKTPILTEKSKSLLLSFFVSGFGAFILAKVPLDKVFTLSAPPIYHVLFVAGLILALLAPANMLRFHIQEVEVEKLKPEERTIVPRLLKKEIETDKTTTARRAEATSIEFREAFASVAKQVAATGKRLVIVLDNIDRLSDDEALAQWSTIRSFFVDRHGEGFPAKNAPVVIVPVDLNSISRVFVPKEDGANITSERDLQKREEFAQSYLDKTFDVVFTVREPALADWRNFFDECLTTTVGDKYSPREIHVARRLYEAEISRNGKRPTPRSIIRFANQVAALALEVRGDVPLATLFAYALNRKAIEKNIAEFVTGERDFSIFDSDWKLNLAAIHFLVERSKAVGPLIRTDLIASISAVDMVKAAALLDGIEGAGDLLVDIAKDPPADESGVISLNIAAFIIALVERHGSSIRGSGHWREELDDDLMRLFLHLTHEQENITGLSSSLAYLGARADQSKAEGLIEKGVAMVDNTIGREAFPRVAVDAVALAIDELVKIRDAHSLSEFSLSAPENPGLALERQLQLFNSSGEWGLLQGPTDKGEIQAHLAKMLEDPVARLRVPKMIEMLRASEHQKLVLTGDKETEQFLGAADTVANDPTQIVALPVVLKSIALLAIDSKEVSVALKGWSDHGLLTERMAQAVEKQDADLIASLLAYGIGADVYFDIPADTNWPTVTLSSEGGRKVIDQILHWSSEGQRISIWQGLIKWPAARQPLLHVRDRFISDVNVKRLEIGKTLAKAETYIANIGGTDFLHKLAEHPEFDKELDKLGVDTLLILLDVQRVATHVKKTLLRKLRILLLGASADEWRSWLLNGSPLFDKLQSIHSLEAIVWTRKTGCAVALEKTVTEVLKDRVVLRRWKLLVGYANHSSAHHAFLAMLSALSDVPDTSSAIGDLRALGKVGDYVQHLDPRWADFLARIVEHEEGRDWVQTNRRSLQAFLNSLPESAVQRLRETFERLARDKREGRRLWGEAALREFFS